MKKLIFDIFERIEELFPKSTLTIKLEKDPEIPNEKELVCTIHTNLNADKALEQLERLDDEFVYLPAKLQEIFLFDVFLTGENNE